MSGVFRVSRCTCWRSEWARIACSGILVGGWAVSLGMAGRQPSVLNDMDRFCDEALAANSRYALLHRERDRLFPDEMFAESVFRSGPAECCRPWSWPR